jgi:hypothetical protein
MTFSPIIKIIKLKLHILDAEKLGVKEMCELYPTNIAVTIACDVMLSLTLQIRS